MCTYEYNGILSSLKKKEMLLHAVTWMKLEDTVLSDYEDIMK